MAYRLLALDVDGTLVHGDREYEFSPTLRSAIARATDRGVRITLATGRMFRSARRIADELGFNAPLVCYNGALVRPLEETTPWYHEPVPTDLALQVIDFARDRKLHINTYVDDEICVERHTPEAEYSARVARVSVREVDDLAELLGTAPTTKLVIITDRDATGPLAAELSARFEGRLGVTRSLPEYVEIVHPAVSKWRSLELVAERYGFTADDVIAVGDSYNDLEMIQRAGLGVAMGNAPDAVKAKAHCVAPSVHEDGVAWVIENYLLG